MEAWSGDVNVARAAMHQELFARDPEAQQFKADQHSEKQGRRQELGGPRPNNPCKTHRRAEQLVDGLVAPVWPDFQKFIPAINTGSVWPCRNGKATASRKAPFWKIPRPPDTPIPTECLADAGLPWSQTDPVS